jgi:hypothetical protein
VRFNVADLFQVEGGVEEIPPREFVLLSAKRCTSAGSIRLLNFGQFHRFPP